MNKTIQDLKMEIEAVKKTQSEGVVEMEHLGKRLETADTPTELASQTEYKRWKREYQVLKIL